MRLPDANVLIYAADTSSSRHDAARDWVQRSLSGTETVGLATVVMLAFVRLTTNPRVFERPLTVPEAFDQLEDWLGRPPVTAVHPGPRHLSICRELLGASGTAGNLTTDAHLAALALEHGAVLASFDGDFRRFAQLELEYLG